MADATSKLLVRSSIKNPKKKAFERVGKITILSKALLSGHSGPMFELGLGKII